MKRKISIMIAEDHKLVREGYVSLLEEYPDFLVIGEAADGKRIIEMLEKKQPDILLLDLEMPLINGNEVMDFLCARLFKTKVIVITMYDDELTIQELFAKGIKGFLSKGYSISQLTEALYAVMKGELYSTGPAPKPKMSDKQRRSFFKQHTLSEREMDVLKKICEGKTNKDIAAELSITARTVEFHKENLFKKTHTDSIAALVIFAIKNGIIFID